MNKYLLSIIALVAICFGLNAQQNVYIHMKDGSWAEFPIADVKAINFKAPGEKPQAKITLSESYKVLLLEKEKSFTLTYAYTSATDETPTVTWSSSDEKVATVKDGLVTAKGSGYASITASVGTVSASCLVLVDDSFTSQQNFQEGLERCYSSLMGHYGYSANLYVNDTIYSAEKDPYKPYILYSTHRALDSQGSGLDKDFCQQKYTSRNEQIQSGWVLAYVDIITCSNYLKHIEIQKSISGADRIVSEDFLKDAEGQVRALRAYQYFWLATNFGRVPVVENVNQLMFKACMSDDEEMWDFIIAEFKAAAELLDWTTKYDTMPYACTKGMALAFLGDAYMWKAYKCPVQQVESYRQAKEYLEQVVKSGQYKLQPSYSTLWDFEDGYWSDLTTGYRNSFNREYNSESIFQVVVFKGSDWGSWVDYDNVGHRGWTGFYFGPTSNGGWGTYQLSWELYDAFENYTEGQYAGTFDKRRDASLVTATVPVENIPVEKRAKWAQRVRPTKAWLEDNSKYLRGYDDGVFNQFVYDSYIMTEEGSNGLYDPQYGIGFNPFNQEFAGWCGFHWASADPAPTVWSCKHWRNGRGTDWRTGALWLPDRIYLKRLANVYLDLAECCFQLGYADEGWQYVNAIRNRAFGNDEVGKDLSKYAASFQNIADFYDDSDGHGDAVDIDGYPIPFNTTVVEVPDALTYYAQLKAEKGFSSPVWKVAVNEERRKEFNAEWCLFNDLRKSDYLMDHFEHNYPKTYDIDEYGLKTIKEWRTCRKFNQSPEYFDLPIPSFVIDNNPNIEQAQY